MNDNNDSQLNDLDSTYPEINIPEFHSTIPEHLLHNVSMENRFVMENLNIQTQYIKWLCESAIDTNLQVRKTNGRLKKVESWKEKISSIWVAGTAVITVICTCIIIGAKIFNALTPGQLAVNL